MILLLVHLSQGNLVLVHLSLGNLAHECGRWTCLCSRWSHLTTDHNRAHAGQVRPICRHCVVQRCSRQAGTLALSLVQNYARSYFAGHSLRTSTKTHAPRILARCGGQRHPVDEKFILWRPASIVMRNANKNTPSPLRECNLFAGERMYSQYKLMRIQSQEHTLSFSLGNGEHLLPIGLLSEWVGWGSSHMVTPGFLD